MEVGPDGSLCRLTSSFDNVSCKVRIAKVSEEELESLSTGVNYKLVLIGGGKSDCESASEKSDEEPFTLESLDIELGISKPEKAEDKTEEAIVKKPYNKNTRNRPFNRRFRQNNANRYCKNYSSPSQRNYKHYKHGNKSYNRRKNKRGSNDINPWLEPPHILNPMENYQFGSFSQYVSVVMDSSMNTPVNSNIDPPKPKSHGLLGNSPFDPHPYQPNFQAGNATNHFPHTQNYYTEEYSNNYQHPVQNMPMSDKPPYKKHHNRKFWKNRPKYYNRYRNRNQKNRGENGNGRFYQQQ